jgi:hypothetical protein
VTPADPRVITVTLPLRPELLADPEAEKSYCQGLAAAVRDTYPSSIVEVCWSQTAAHVQIDYPGDRDDVREEVLVLTERFSRLWLLAFQAVRNYLGDRLAHYANLLPTGPAGSQLIMQETCSNLLFSQRRLLDGPRS